MAFFSHKRGAVSRVVSPQGQGTSSFTIQMNLDGATTLGQGNAKAIVTQAAIGNAGNLQFLHTLNQTIYVYVFGDRIGDLRVSGLAFAEPCRTSGTGMQLIYKAYKDNRVAKKGGPVLVHFGDDLPLRAFLVGMSLEVADPETNLGQWSFLFKTFPGN